MSSGNKQAEAIGCVLITLFVLGSLTLGTVFLTLKIAGVVEWNWLVVFLPLYPVAFIGLWINLKLLFDVLTPG